MAFAHLHVHSNYSLLCGASRLEELVARAVELEFTHLALTDTNALYGAMAFDAKAREAGLEPIIGATIDHERKHAVCLARDFETGYANLCRLITARHLDEDFDLAAALERHQDGLFILTDSPALLADLAERIPPGGLYAELTHVGPEVARDRRQRLLALARDYRIEPVATNAVHFHVPERHAIHRVLMAVRENGLVDQVPARLLAHPQAYLKSSAKMRALFREVPEAIDTAARIARRCRVTFPTGTPIFPRVDLPPGETPYSRLSKLAFEGLARRYQPITPETVKRLQYELDVINRLGFSEYFLVVWDIVNYAHSHDIPVVGRGSAGNSLVSYCLGISSVDPIAYDLYFERFLNLSRTDCPDIDLDFDWRKRDEVIDYVYRTHGRDRVAMIATYNCFQARSAFRDVGRAFGLAPEEVDRLSSRLPFYAAKGIRDAILSFPESRDFPIDREPIGRIVDIAETIDGFPRHLSVHVGGIVIADRPLTHYLPLERAAKGLVITQYESGPVEALGLVKIDLLAQRSLSIVADTVKAARAHYGAKAEREVGHIDRLPGTDARTARLLRRGRTVGCFQIESPGMRSLLQMMNAATRLDVILGLSLIRPGPSSSGMKHRFIARRRGLEAPEYLHPALNEVLADTYGVMLYQEDILRVAHAVAGFTLAEGDQLRKAISKRRSPERIAALKAKFVTGAVANGTTSGNAERLWTLIANFAAYSYCKAHACTYGHIAYQATYLKARYPAEFLAAVLNNLAGFYEPREYVEEARRWGVKIRLPDVNESDILYQSIPASRAMPRGAIRIGLMQIRHLTRRTMNRIVKERKRRRFRTLADFLGHTRPQADEARALVLCGALDGLGASRPALLWALDCRLAERPGHAGDTPLFGDEAPPRRTAEDIPPIPDYSEQRTLELEEQYLGLTPTAHPLARYREQIQQGHYVPSDQLDRYVGREVTVVGSLIASRRARTRQNQFMKFLTLEDLSGTMEVLMFPRVYQRDGFLVRSRGPFVVTGTVGSQHGSVSITASSVDLLPAAEPA